MALIRGIDVSSAQGSVPWPLVARDPAGIKFAIIKGYEGNAGISPGLVRVNGDKGMSGLDPNFARNVQGARSEGLRLGCYNFGYSGAHKTGTQAPFRKAADECSLHFDETGGLGQGPDDLGPFADAEWPAPQDWALWNCTAISIRTWWLDYLEAAETIYHKAPTLYTYPDWWAHIGGASEPAFARYPLWMASYRNPTRWPTDGELPSVPAPWTAATWWQTSGGTVRVAGMVVDTDVYLGDTLP